MGDGGQSDAVELKVTFADGTTMSLSDWLAQVNGIPSDATVQLSDGTTESAADYQAYVHQQADKILNDFSHQMTVRVEDLSTLASAMSWTSGSIMSYLRDLQAKMHGIDAAIGDDDAGKSFKANFDKAFDNIVRNGFPALSQSVSNVADGLNTCAGDVFNCEQATLQGFGRQAVDPRARPGHGRMGVE
jgi:hypothetical protein